MKKLQFLLPLMAMVMAIAGVGATTISHQQKVKATIDGELVWYTDVNATNFVQENTVEDEATANCPGEGDICEYGYQRSDLNDPDDEMSGLKPGHGSPEIIRELE